MNKPPKFESEAALCAAFIADIHEQRGWIVYPETAGFDILLVREDTGHQLGLEAKLTLNAKVADQIIPGPGSAAYYGCPWGPDWRGIIVPAITEASAGIAKMLGILGVMTFTPERDYSRQRWGGDWKERWKFSIEEPGYYDLHWHDWNPGLRCPLPELVPSVAAGVPAPIQLTPWKIGALKVMADLELDGFVTSKSVRERGVDPRRFCAADGWLTPLGDAKWGAGRIPRFDLQHPTEYAQILAAARAERTKELANGTT